LLADWLADWTEGDVRGNSTKATRSATLHRLSARGIQAAGEGDHADGGGLMLRVRGASASWVYRFTSPTGRRREMGLGVAHRGTTAQAGESVTTARRVAHEAREQLTRGLDPIDERDKVRTAAQQAEAEKKAERARERWTLARWARDYHERVIEPTRTDKHSAQWISSLENHVPSRIWNKPIDAIEPPELLQALREIRPHERARNLTQGASVPETVQRIRQRLEAVFEDAIFHKRCTLNPAAAVKRKMREEQPARDRGQFAALPYREAPALMAELRKAEGIAARCLEFAVLTTARTSEALLAEWSEFDLDAGLWTVPASRMKAKEPHVVYLSPRALAIVEAQRGLDPVYLFPSPLTVGATDEDGRPLPSKPLSNMAMLNVLGRMGMRDRTTVHGLCRATFSTWANETAAARPDVIEACLAHEESNRVRAAYNRAQFAEERRALLVAWSDYLQTSNVVALRAA
jgi:integrase